MIAAFAVCGAVIVAQSALIIWFALSTQIERRQVFNAAMSKSPAEFRSLERVVRPKEPESYEQEARRVLAAQGDDPARMPEGFTGL